MKISSKEVVVGALATSLVAGCLSDKPLDNPDADEPICTSLVLQNQGVDVCNCDDVRRIVRDGLVSPAQMVSDDLQRHCGESDYMKIDYDGDGITIEAGDCDETNPNIHPEAGELCGDGIDSDCDGEDSNGFIIKSYAPDEDGDGYPNSDASVRREFCEGTQPTGYIEFGGRQVDCNDQSVDLNPGATEINFDEVDQDCSGMPDDRLSPDLCPVALNDYSILSPDENGFVILPESQIEYKVDPQNECGQIEPTYAERIRRACAVTISENPHFTRSQLISMGISILTRNITSGTDGDIWIALGNNNIDRFDFFANLDEIYRNKELHDEIYDLMLPHIRTNVIGNMEPEAVDQAMQVLTSLIEYTQIVDIELERDFYNSLEDNYRFLAHTPIARSNPEFDYLFETVSTDNDLREWQARIVRRLWDGSMTRGEMVSWGLRLQKDLALAFFQERGDELQENPELRARLFAATRVSDQLIIDLREKGIEALDRALVNPTTGAIIYQR